MVRVLSDGDVAAVLDLPDLLDVVADATRKQRDGAVERPERPHFPVGRGLDPGDLDGIGDSGDPGDPGDSDDHRDRDPDQPAGTGLVMPAYVHGADHYATKLASVHEDNPGRGLSTVQAQIALTEAGTGRPAAYLEGTRITNARTGCLGGLAARALADPPVDLGILGAGTQARWQARAIAAATDLQRIRVYSPSDSRVECARDLREELGVDATPSDTAREAVTDANVVVTATTATDPVFPGDALAPGTVVVAVGAYTAEMRELDRTTVDRARRIYADVPDEVAGIGDLPDADPDELRPFADALDDAAPFDGDQREGAGGEGDLILVESVGSAVLDAATAEHVFRTARDTGAGTEADL